MRWRINPGNRSFASRLKAGFVDKSEMIEVLNGTIESSSRLSCISRPRRFGKSTVAEMIRAYYVTIQP